MEKTGNRNNKWLRKIYQSMENGKARSFYIKADSFAQKHGGKLYDRTIRQLKQQVRNSAVRQNTIIREDTFESLCWNYEKKFKYPLLPLVSIIVPVTDTSLHLEKCLKSIYSQTYQNFEVFILEYNLSGQSKNVIAECIQGAPQKTTVISRQQKAPYTTLEQWNEGLKLASGTLVWIAETNSYCDAAFLAETVRMFSYGSVKLVFSKSVLISNSGIEIEQERQSNCRGPIAFEWKKPFYITAHNVVRYGFAFQNMIPSMGGTVFKNTGSIPAEILELYKNKTFCDRWIYNLYLIQGGVIGYTNAATSYYSAYTDISSSERKAADYYKEMEDVTCYIASHYRIEDNVYDQIFQNLVEQREKKYGKAISGEHIKQYYHIERIQLSKKERQPNILMACYALKSGGGEIYPIHLANELHRHGVAVTLLNFNIEEEEENVRQLIDAKVPVVTIKSKDFLKHIITQLGGEVIHSHHASTDEIISQWIICDKGLCRHVITLHGMYESMRKEDCDRVIAATWDSCEKYIYIADKNLDCFKERNYDIGKKFIRIPNGMPRIDINPVSRKSLGIPDDAFVLTIASRGIPQKGWKEAIYAVTEAASHSSRPIHLVIVGDGEVRADLEKGAPSFVHFTGFRPNVRDYLAMADAGLVPTYFKGESYPLIIIECLLVGIPVIATDIAEAKNQLKDENGDLAGVLLPLHNWTIDENDITAAILGLVNDHDSYMHLKERTCSACKKFDMSAIADRHVRLYREILGI